MLTSCLNASAWVFCWLNVLFMLHCMKTLCPHSSWYCWWFNSRIMLVAQSWWVCTYCPTSQGTVEWGCYWSAFHVIHVKNEVLKPKLPGWAGSFLSSPSSCVPAWTEAWDNWAGGQLRSGDASFDLAWTWLEWLDLCWPLLTVDWFKHV